MTIRAALAGLAPLLARLGLATRKDALRARVPALVEAGDAAGLSRLVDRERGLFAAERFGCRFDAHERWRAPPEFSGIEVARRPGGNGAKLVVVEIAGGEVRYRPIFPGWQPPAARAQNFVRLVTRIAHVHPLFERAAALGAGPGRLLLDTDDVAEAEDKVVGFSGDPSRVFLVPDQVFVATDGYAGLRRRYAETFVPFAERARAVFWRGRPTGVLPADGDWRGLPRARFVAAVRGLAAEMPEVAFDVGLVEPKEAATARFWPEIVAAGLDAPFVPIETFVRQGIHVDIDGNSNSWPGLFSKILLGGAILKVRSRHAQWYYDRLDGVVAWVAADLSDLGATARRVAGGDAARLSAAAATLAAAMTGAAELDRAAATIDAAMAYWAGRL